MPQAGKETLQVESTNLTSKLVTGRDDSPSAQVTEAVLLNDGKQKETTNGFP